MSMATSTYSVLRGTRVPALLLCAAAVLTACGDERPGAAGAPTQRDGGVPTPRVDGTAPSSGASPYVEPGVIDGAPHNRENNAYRRPAEVSLSGRAAAWDEAARIHPVLKRLWETKKWDAFSVRTELVDKLGYEDRLDVQEQYPTAEGDQEGALIGLSVGDDACVTGYIGATGFGADVNGRFPETGCVTPPTGH